MGLSLNVYGQNHQPDTLFYSNGIVQRITVFNELDSSWTIYDYYQNGQLRSVQPTGKEMDKKHGIRSCYNPNGMLAYIIPFKNDKLSGQFIEFYQNGTVKKTGRFYNNFKTGSWIHYDLDGTIIEKQEFHITKEDSNFVITEKFLLNTNDSIYYLNIHYGNMPIRIKYGNSTITETLDVKESYMIIKKY